MKVLVVNAGSSSLKYQLFDTSTNEVLAKGLCERIAIDGRIEHKLANGKTVENDIAMPDHAVATSIVIDYLTNKYGEDRVVQVMNIVYTSPITSIRDIGKLLGFSYKEIARLLDIKPKFLSKRLTLIRNVLRKKEKRLI